VLNATSYAKVEAFNTSGEIMQLPAVSSRQDGATEIRVFVLDEEKELLKQVASEKGIAVSHLLRALALAWVQQNQKSA
jgi:myo-inositol-hexaphosphate 3-phosphohydrolase